MIVDDGRPLLLNVELVAEGFVNVVPGELLVNDDVFGFIDPPGFRLIRSIGDLNDSGD